MQPTQADIAAVGDFLNGQPTPTPTLEPQAPAPQQAPQAAPQAPEPQQPQAPEPAQQQPAQPTAQPAPSSQPQDPFAMMAQPAPQPQPQAQPQQPAPQAPTPQAQPQAQPQEEFMSFDDYMNSVTAGVGDAPAMPDMSKVDPNDEAGIKNFFDDLVNTAVQRAEQSVNRKSAIQTAERKVWDEAFGKYPTLRENKPIRDMVHSIRMGEFQRGVAITPTQAAEKLLGAFQQQYQRGITDNQVQTTIEQVQPSGGGGQTIPTTVDRESVLTSIQTGGETALADYLDGQIKAGNI